MSSHLIRQDFVPVLSGYVLLMAVLAGGLWAAGRRLRAGKPLTRATGRLDHGWAALIWHVLADALGGYLLLVAVVVLYYYLVAKVGSDFLKSAFSGAALLVGITLPVLLAASWLSERRAGRRANRGHPPEQRGNGRPGTRSS